MDTSPMGAPQGGSKPFGGNQPQWPSAPPPKPAQGPSVPEMPPPQTVTVRSMQSDVKSVSRGESVPIPESVMAPEPKKDTVFSPQTQTAMGAMPQVAMGDEDADDSGKKRMFIWGATVAGVIAIGLLGYFVVYPMLFRGEEPAPPAPPAPPPAVRAPHTSYFLTAPALKTSIPLTGLNLINISAAFQPIVSSNLPDGSFQEVEIQSPDTGQVPWPSYLAAFNTGLTADQLPVWFEDDFTAFTYQRDGKTWPGYVAKLRQGITPEALRMNLAPFETSDLSTFFLVPPGTAQGGFKDGTLANRSSRYLVYSQSGAALNYAVLDSYLIISTSYDGAKQAATLLGF